MKEQNKEVNFQSSEAELDPHLHEFDQLEEEKCIHAPDVPRIHKTEIENQVSLENLFTQIDKLDEKLEVHKKENLGPNTAH